MHAHIPSLAIARTFPSHSNPRRADKMALRSIMMRQVAPMRQVRLWAGWVSSDCPATRPIADSLIAQARRSMAAPTARTFRATFVRSASTKAPEVADYQIEEKVSTHSRRMCRPAHSVKTPLIGWYCQL